jgi:hypothetical protein
VLDIAICSNATSGTLPNLLTENPCHIDFIGWKNVNAKQL